MAQKRCLNTFHEIIIITTQQMRLHRSLPIIAQQQLLKQRSSIHPNSINRCIHPFLQSELRHHHHVHSRHHQIRSFVSSPDTNSSASLNQKDYTDNAFDALVNLLTLSELYQVPQIESELLLKSLINSGEEGLSHRILSKSNLLQIRLSFISYI